MSFTVYFVILAAAGMLTGAVAYTVFGTMSRDGIVGASLGGAIVTVVIGGFAAFFLQAPEILGLVGAIVAGPVWSYFIERSGESSDGWISPGGYAGAGDSCDSGGGDGGGGGGDGGGSC